MFMENVAKVIMPPSKTSVRVNQPGEKCCREIEDVLNKTCVEMIFPSQPSVSSIVR